ncbi:hypothetical protein HMI54_012387 [Coelomomyces lativittatus]|nr:hypothetical protein HMI54_012387 [Coelomomyces lativittatus]KAJ1508310.1 hypothetical protein HMI56_007352 [Coelomomyces lativittatus]KAJ1510863.1 hypothetical protein HMI55_006820 [Coelomomyces lativittatus]
MSLSRYTYPELAPMDSFDRMFHRMRDMNRTFADMMDLASPFTTRSTDASGMVQYAPRVDFRENEKGFSIHADLPGIPKENVKIEARDNSLILSGENRREVEKDQGQYHYSERQYGRFMRTVPMPSTADLENVKATYENGVLLVDVPKKKEAAARRIKIS